MANHNHNSAGQDKEEADPGLVSEDGVDSVHSQSVDAVYNEVDSEQNVVAWNISRVPDGNKVEL